MKARRGVTLVEVMLAGGIMVLASLAIFEGIIVSTRIAHENAEILKAEAVVWDAVWKKFNEDYEKMGPQTFTWVVSSNAAPDLVRSGYAAPVLTLSVTIPQAEGFDELRCIEGDIEWGPTGRRKRLSDIQRTFVYRGPLERSPTW